MKQCLFTNSQHGSSLVGVLVASGIAGIVAVAMATLYKNSHSAMKSVELHQDVGVIRRTMEQSLDCAKTLNLTAASTLPATCPSSLVLKRKGGQPITTNGKLGAWTINARCVDYNIKVGVTKSGKDPLTNKAWADATAPGTTIKLADDAFGGLSDFCRPYLDPAYATPTPKPGFGGTYMSYPWLQPSPQCPTPNPYTGACTCPPTYKPTLIFHFRSRCIWGFYGYPGSTDASGYPINTDCGAMAYACYN